MIRASPRKTFETGKRLKRLKRLSVFLSFCEAQRCERGIYCKYILILLFIIYKVRVVWLAGKWCVRHIGKMKKTFKTFETPGGGERVLNASNVFWSFITINRLLLVRKLGVSLRQTFAFRAEMPLVALFWNFFWKKLIKYLVVSKFLITFAPWFRKNWKQCAGGRWCWSQRVGRRRPDAVRRKKII